MRDLIISGQMPGPRGMIVQTFPRTADGFYVVGQKSQKFYSTLNFVSIGGVYSVEDGVIQHPFDMAIMELTEELGIGADHISSLSLVGGNRNPSLNYTLLFSTDLVLSRDELLKIFTNSNERDGELSELSFVEGSELQAFIAVNLEHGESYADFVAKALCLVE